MPPEPLDGLMSSGSGALCARLWRGYIAHALLFYRQNHLGGRLKEVARIGKSFDIGPSGDLAPPGSPQGPGWDLALAGQRSGDIKKAAAALERALRADPKNPSFYVLRGLLAHEDYWGSARMTAASLADFERALELAPGSHWAHLFAGMAHEMHRRYTRAVAHFDQAAALKPGWSWPHVMRGICRWYMAEFAGCVEDFKKAAKLDPTGELPLLFMARAKADLRDASLIEDLDRALELAPRSPYALSWRGRAMFILKRTPEALEDLKRSIPLLPDYDRGWSWLGVSYVELGRWAKAAELLRKAHKLNPHYPTTLYPLAHANIRLGRWDQAAAALKEGAFIDRHGVWVEHRISMGHPNPACLRSLADLDRYLERRPKTAWALAWRGQTKLLLQDYQAALTDLDRAIELDPRDPWAKLWRGETHRRLGEFPEALADLGAALRLDAKLSWAHAARGHALLCLGRDAEALKALNRSLELRSFCPPALAWRGEARLRAGDWSAAAADLEAALELRPQDHWLHRFLWRARARLGDWKGVLASLSVLSRAAGSRSDEVWALIGWAQGRLGLEEQAVASLARALEANPAQPLALLETACWWGRHGEKERARFVLDRAGMPGRKALPRSVPVAEAERLCAAERPEEAFEPARLLEQARRSQTPDCVAAIARGDWRAAAAALDPSESLRRDLQACLLRGWVKLQAGDARGAAEEASRALDHNLDPHCASALWLRAQAEALVHA